MRMHPARTAMTVALLTAATLGACGGDAGDSDLADAPAVAPVSADDQVATPAGPQVVVPTDCAEVPTDALAEVFGAEPILDVDDSYYEEPIEELSCSWWDTPQARTELTVQISLAEDYFGMYSALETMGSAEFTPVDGFDEARLYEGGRLVAKRNGFAVVLSHDGDLTGDQLVAIALDATQPHP